MKKEEVFDLALLALGILAVIAGGKIVSLVYQFSKNEKKYLPIVKQYAENMGINPYNFAALIAKESSFNPKAFRREAAYKWGTNPDYPEGGDASYGLGQILYSTARGLLFTGTPSDLYDPDMNLDVVSKYFKTLLDLYGGNYMDAHAHYNSGKPYSKAPDVTKTDYVPKVLAYAAQFEKERVFESA
jgi:soluble lytic murein transglycosylase-like protein